MVAPMRTSLVLWNKMLIQAQVISYPIAYVCLFIYLFVCYLFCLLFIYFVVELFVYSLMRHAPWCLFMTAFAYAVVIKPIHLLYAPNEKVRTSMALGSGVPISF